MAQIIQGLVNNFHLVAVSDDSFPCLWWDYFERFVMNGTMCNYWEPPMSKSYIISCKAKYKCYWPPSILTRTKGDGHCWGIPSEFDLKIAHRDGKWPISAQYSDDITEEVRNSCISHMHLPRSEGDFRCNGIDYSHKLVNSNQFLSNIIKSIMW